MAVGFSFKVLKDLSGMLQGLATETVNSVIRVMVMSLYNEFAKASGKSRRGIFYD